MSWKRESLALAFGALIICEIFGDQFFFEGVGNLDSLFGLGTHSNEAMDVVYPFASIAVLVLYGRLNGPIFFSPKSVLLIVPFLVSLGVLQFDDFFVLVGHPITLTSAYWAFARLFYLFVSTAVFLLFADQCRKNAAIAKGRE